MSLPASRLAPDVIQPAVDLNCHSCMPFRDNNRTVVMRCVCLKAAWARHFDLVVQQDRIRYKGCLIADRSGYNYPPPKCPIAPCAVARGFEPCTSCIS